GRRSGVGSRMAARIRRGDRGEAAVASPDLPCPARCRAVREHDRAWTARRLQRQGEAGPRLAAPVSELAAGLSGGAGVTMEAGVEQRWVAIQHVPYEGPGLIPTEAARRGIGLEAV